MGIVGKYLFFWSSPNFGPKTGLILSGEILLFVFISLLPTSSCKCAYELLFNANYVISSIAFNSLATLNLQAACKYKKKDLSQIKCVIYLKFVFVIEKVEK